ncbi:MAG: hypothetical protein KDB21_21235 [Acidimicrobiales bacterium]|nr:hypothetical protein [Acidimicrobiales bacterium]
MATRRPIDVAVMKFYGALIVLTGAIWVPVAVWVGATEDRKWPFLNVAFCVSWIIALVLTAIILEYARRRPAGTPVSWGEAALGSVFVFALMFWIYGVVPHQWLTFADNELNWRADRDLVGPEFGFTDGKGFLAWVLPFKLTYLVVRDIIAVTIYGLALAGNIAIWSVWQNRGKQPATSVEESRFGRPLVREGAGV